MKKLNCWEMKKCGREVGGRNMDKLGICPAAVESRANGINGGQNGGRSCWMIAGTLCGNQVQGTFANKISSCLDCDFYELAMREESEPENISSILKKLE